MICALVSLLWFVGPFFFGGGELQSQIVATSHHEHQRVAVRERLTEELSNKRILLLHSAKTGGSSSKVFAQECMNLTYVDNVLDRESGLAMLNNTRLLASHLYSPRWWSRVLRVLTEETVVLVPVRPFSSWYPSAVLHVAHRFCVAEPKCRVREPACVITSKMLHNMTRARLYELNIHIGHFFTAADDLKRRGLLRSKVFLVDFHHLDVVHDVISRMLCPSVSAKRYNVRALKKRIFLDSAHMNGSCAELSADAKRSQVNLLSLAVDSGPYVGWRNNSIPAEVWEEGLWEYA